MTEQRAEFVKPESTRCAVCSRRLDSGEVMTCDACIDRIDQALEDVVILYALLPDVILPGSVQLNDLPHGKRVDAPAPARLEVIDLMDGRLSRAHGWVTDRRRGVIGLLESWATLVREERQLSVPTTPATIVSEVGVLRNWLSWVVQQPWIDEMASEVLKLHRDMKAICGEQEPKSIGKCPAVNVNADGVAVMCGANLYAPISGEVVRCRRCRTQWTREHWLLLGKTLEETG